MSSESAPAPAAAEAAPPAAAAAADPAPAAAAPAATVTLGSGAAALTGVSQLGFGAMGITAFYNDPLSDDAGLALLREVYAQGYRHFDTAEVYRSGNPFAPPDDTTIFNEAVVGKFLADLRGEKYGEAASAARARPYSIATKYFPGLHGGQTDEESVTAAVDASLARLGERTIDLYYLHRPPATVELLEQWVHSAKKLVEAGKLRFLGLSEVPPAWVRRAHAIHPITAYQLEWSAITRGVEEDVIPTLRELGIGVVAYSPLARNLLAGVTEAPTDAFRSTSPRFSGENFERNKVLVARIGETAKTLGASVAQLSLAWLYHRASELGVTVVPIPGTTKAAHAADNIAALRLLPLPAEVATAIDELSKEVAGARATEGYLKSAYEGFQ